MKHSHLLLLSAQDSDMRIFGIPGTGGKGDCFRMMADMLGDTCAMYGLHMMGIHKGETPLNNIIDVAAQNIKWVQALQPEGPYRFIGHSFGSYVAYEMARQLELDGYEVEFTAIMDEQVELVSVMPPHLTPAEFVLDLAAGYFDWVKLIQQPYTWDASLKEELEHLPATAMTAVIAAHLKTLFPDKKQTIERVSRLINVRVYNAPMTYLPPGKINAPVIIFRADDSEWGVVDDTLEWCHYTDNIRVYKVPGDHQTILDTENVKVLAGFLKQEIRMPVVR